MSLDKTATFDTAYDFLKDTIYDGSKTINEVYGISPSVAIIMIGAIIANLAIGHECECPSCKLANRVIEANKTIVDEIMLTRNDKKTD